MAVETVQTGFPITKALDGVTILELSQGIAGPYCACLLGELGARVLKVEPPGGDWLRKAGGRVGNSTVMFESFNHGKQSIVLDLKSATGAATVQRLAQHADVIVENARVGTMARFGLGYAQLAATRPALIYTSISGFGQQGPRSNQPATDTVIQAYTGIASHATSAEGPQRLRIALVDVVSGLYASQATLAALMQRWRSGGQGQWVQISLAHAMAALQAYKIADTLINGETTDQEATAVVGNYQTRDGALSISAASDAQVVAALKALDLEDLVVSPEFADPEARFSNQVALREKVARALARLDLGEALGRLQAAQVPCQEILNYPKFVADVRSSMPGLFQSIHCADGTPILAVRAPGIPDESRLERAPALDEHAALIKTEFQLDQ